MKTSLAETLPGGLNKESDITYRDFRGTWSCASDHLQTDRSSDARRRKDNHTVFLYPNTLLLINRK